MDKKERILIVEDDEMLLVTLKMVFEMHGFEVSAAENGQIALEQLQAASYDYVLSDFNMPIMDGMTLLKKMKKTIHPFPVVVIFTGHSSYPFEEFIHNGAVAAFNKPVDVNKIILTLRKHRKIL